MIGYLTECFFSGVCALPVLLLLRLVFGKRLSGGGRFFLILYVLYISMMFGVVGLPAIPYLSWGPSLNLIPFSDFQDRRFFLLSGMNVLMFVPLGFLLPAYFDRYRHWGRTLFAGIATSLTVELIQLFTLRATDVDDLLMNTLGTLVGYLAAKLIFRHRSAVYRGRKDWLELVVINVIVLLVIVFFRYPLMEAILNLLRA